MTAPTLPSSNDRRRRRRLRLIPIIGYTFVALGLAYFLQQRASTTVIFVRHADTDVAMAATDDPPLNARGRQRAELLADFLENIDVVAGVNAIYASDKRRTQETAAPLAKRLNLPVEIADHLDTEGFMDTRAARSRRRHRADRLALEHDRAADRRAARQQALAAVRPRRVRRDLHRHDSGVRQGQDAAVALPRAAAECARAASRQRRAEASARAGGGASVLRATPTRRARDSTPACRRP